jgi:NTP pyrophosphatase (non-canonical NTP hydrolase)
MDFSEYQKGAKTTAIYPDRLEGRFFYPSMGLAGEVGELLNKIKKIARDDAEVSKDEIKGEVGDILWYLSQICTEFGIELDDAAAYNLEKLRSRRERGKIGGSGDNR